MRGWKKLMAIAFLGGHFLLRVYKRIFFIRSAGFKDFLQFYRDDKIGGHRREDKTLLVEAARCISCGLCDLFCPAVKNRSQEDFLGPSFFSHLSRSIPDFVGNVALDLEDCQGCRGCELICPENVPLKKIAGFMKQQTDSIHQKM